MSNVARLVDILVCPDSKQSVRMLGEGEIQELNERITRSELKNRRGEVLTEPLEGGLVREDGLFAYPVRDDIPIMLVDEAVDLQR